MNDDSCLIYSLPALRVLWPTEAVIPKPSATATPLGDSVAEGENFNR